MVLEDEFVLFKRTGKQSGALFSGRRNLKLRRVVTRPLGFLLKPIAGEFKRRARKRIKAKAKGIFGGPRFMKVSVREALEFDRPK